jgi:hypothetical protein
MKRICFFILSILLLAPVAVRADETGPFRIEIANSGRPYNTGGLWITANVTNISDKDQPLARWTQYGWNWASDTPLIVPDISATQNEAQAITLPPGKTYAAPVPVYFATGKRGVTFRLGFCPAPKAPVSTNPGSCGDLYWSNPVTLKEEKE